MRSFVKSVARRARTFLTGPTLDAIQQIPSGPDAAAQILLQLEYRRLARDGCPLSRIGEAGFTVFSQTDEDGILLYLFALIGVRDKTCVEICAGDGIECNTANLILNHGWQGLLVDGDEARVEWGKRYYKESRFTYLSPPRFVHCWVTRGGVNDLIGSNGFQGEIDLLSLDLNGIDYWIWEAIEVVTPRVVVLEYHNVLGPDRAWTVPYSDDFCSDRYPMTDGMPNYVGASLPAFVKLGRRKGYRLVGVNRLQYNAFFVRNGFADDLLPEIAAKDCFSHPTVLAWMRERFPTIKDLPWIEV